MRLTPRTIMGQLIAGTVIVQLLVFAVFLAFSVPHQYHHAQQRDMDRLRRQTTTIANLLADPLAKNDPTLIDEVLHAVPIAASVKGARITDTYGSVLRNTSNDLPMVLTSQELSMLPDLAKNPHYRAFTTHGGDLESAQPIIADGLVRGIIWITEDSTVTLTTPVSVIESLLFYSPFALIGNLLLVWALSGSLARPLRRLRRASQQVQLDPNDLSAFPLPAAENNEAGELTASVNAMVNEIASQRRGTQDTLSLLDAMLTGAPIGFGFYDRDYRYVRVNEQIAMMHGVPAEDHIGRRLRDISPPRALAMAIKVEALIQRVFDTEKPAPDDEIIGYLRSDDIENTFRTSYFPVFAAGEVRWVGVIATDITESRRTEVAVRSSEKLAAAGRLAASIANDISNPLESVTNLLYLLRGNNSLNREADDYLALAQSEIARIGEITQSTLSFYRQPRAASELAVADVLRSALSLFGSRFESAGIEVELQLDEAALLFGYPGELRQMFATLMSNAIESMPYGGRLQLRTQRRRRCGVAGVHVTLAHNGTPLSDDLRRQLLEPIADNVTNPIRNAGSPPTFWTDEEILEKHRGSLQIRTPGAHFRGEACGTIFRFFFPVRGVPNGPFIVHSTPSRVLADQAV